MSMSCIHVVVKNNWLKEAELPTIIPLKEAELPTIIPFHVMVGDIL